MYRPTVLLAALDNGQHVQIGSVRPQHEADALHARLDADLTGWRRDWKDDLVRSGAGRPHYVDGHAVKLYRLRQQGHEFGTVPSYPVRSVRFTNQEAHTMKSIAPKRNVKTAGGIARPAQGTFTTWEAARTKARDLNTEHGRGRRALKAQDGTYSVIFRPAVAVNKQRRVRDLGAI